MYTVRILIKVVHFVFRFPQKSVIHGGSLHRPPASLNSPDVYSFTPAKISPLGPQTVISSSRLVWQSSVQIYMRCLYYCIRLLACYVSRERALPGSVFQKLRVKVGRILQTEPLLSIYYSLIVFVVCCCWMVWGSRDSAVIPLSDTQLQQSPRIWNQSLAAGMLKWYSLILRTFNKTTLQVKTTLFTTSEEYTYCRIHCDVIENSTGFFFITYEI